MSNPTTIVSHSTATGEELAGIVNKLESALEGVARGKAIIGLLSLVIILQNPELSTEDLQAVVMDTSRYICLLIEGKDAMASADKPLMH